MPHRPTLLVAVVLTLTGCGYVGDPLPPALNIPVPVTDLAVIQSGGRIRLSFTLPGVTTEQLEIERFREVDLRVGPPAPRREDWLTASQQVAVTDPQPGKPVVLDLAAQPWSGREMLAAVRVRGSSGRYSQWSNSVAFTVREPLPRIEPSAVADPNGVRVTWPDVSGATYRIFRQAPGDSKPQLLATVGKPEYVDSTAAVGNTYSYFVQSVRDGAESLLSPAAVVLAADRFPPAAPSGVIAVAGVNSIELAWERNTEPDLGSYRVYRSQPGADFEVIADAVEGIAYADRQAQPGVRYSYQITAIDKSGNESPRSAAVSAMFQ